MSNVYEDHIANRDRLTRWRFEAACAAMQGLLASGAKPYDSSIKAKGEFEEDLANRSLCLADVLMEHFR